ncbi:MAG: protein kinase, partial [Fuerstiella sp.]
MTMPEDDKSLSDQPTFSGGRQPQDEGPQSLGDEHTFSGGVQNDPQSLGDEATFGDVAGVGEAAFDDGMEVVDLAARYTTEGVLGKGGMGEVLLATDTRLERKVAIKRMLGDGAKSRTAVSRFLTEAKSIAALNHPNIVQIYDYGRATDGPFLIMEYVEGNSLLGRLRDGAIPLDEAIDMTCQLCDGLGAAHKANIIHRDIKPANVLLTNDGIPKLTDFGLAKDETADAGLSVAGAVLGTLDFMPPEQRKDVALTDSRSDLWSLAATLYQMVTGKSPKIIRFNNVPQSLQDVLGKALEDEKDDRYQTAAEFRDALRASQQDTGSEELEEGSCPGCGTKNPTNRKFCRNESCGIDLQVACLSCSEKIPMWEGVCDSCGTKQSTLLQQRRDSMVSSQSEAESLLKSFDFDRATELATSLRDEPDLRLQHLKGWADKFLPQIDQGRQQQLEQMGGQLTEAAAHEQAHDYAAGLRVLSKVPAILREAQVPGHSDTVSGVMSRLQSTLDEIKRLDAEIRQRVKTRKLNGLLSELNQLLNLQPDRKDISTLKTQLLDRDRKLNETRDKAYAAAQQKLSAQDYDRVLEEVARIDKSVLSDEIAQLRDEAIEKRDRLKTLRAAISEAVKTKKLHGLLKKVDECLSLKSDDADMQKLQARLQARDRKNAAQIADVLEKAQGLRGECRFAAASKALGRIPHELQTQKASDLLDDCDQLGALREMSMRALKSAMDSEEYKSGLTKTKDYCDSLETGYLEDEEFSRALAACKRALKEQREAEESAERQRALMKKLAIAAAAVTAVVLLIAAGLWVRSSMNASALAEAVQQQQWDEALAIDDQHVPALVGRANQRLAAETPDIDGAFADIGLAEQVDSTVAELKPAKALAHAKRAASLATDGKITDAEKDLREAETLGSSDSQLTPVRQLLAAAYVKQAEEGVTRGDVPGIRAACDAAERYQAADSDVSRLRAAAFKADGEQKGKSGDLSGAMVAFAEAVKLDSSLGLKTERAVLHVKLGEQAVAKQDYAAAATELYSAVSLDKSATGVVALAVSVAEPVILAFEQTPTVANQTAAIAAWRSASQLDSTAAPTVELRDRLITLLSRPVVAFEQAPTVENQTAALAALSSIQSVDAQNEKLPVLRKGVTALVLKRGESVAGNDPDSALQDYLTALSLVASASESAPLKGKLVTALTARCRQSLGSQDVAKASADYASVAKLDSQAASLLVADFEKLPASVLSQLPTSVLSQLPTSVLSQL